MALALSLRGVVKRYRAGAGSCTAAVEVLRKIDLDVAAGELLGILGAAASGKSTLLRCGAGVLRPDAGTVTCFGESVYDGVRPPGIAYVPERAAYYSFLTVREALDYYAVLCDLSARDRTAQVERALERVHLAPLAETRIARLSLLSLQRLAIAQALLDRPRLIFLDDTLTTLDGLARRDLTDLVRSLHCDGTTVILSSSSASALDGLATRTVVLLHGELVEPPARRRTDVPRAIPVENERAARVAEGRDRV